MFGIEPEQGTAHTIRSPLHTFRMPPGISKNYIIDDVWFFVVLTDAVGTFRLSVEMHSEPGIIVKRSQPQTLTFKGGMQLKAVELRIQLAKLPFPNPGLYEFKLVANHAHLDEGGTAILRVLPG